MLKAGIVTAATAAVLLVASPLAFAGESHQGDHHKGDQSRNSHADSSQQANGVPIVPVESPRLHQHD